MLETRNLRGYYNYCYRCADFKGWHIDFGVKEFDKHIKVNNAYYEEECKNVMDLVNVNLWQIL